MWTTTSTSSIATAESSPSSAAGSDEEVTYAAPALSALETLDATGGSKSPADTDSI